MLSSIGSLCFGEQLIPHDIYRNEQRADTTPRFETVVCVAEYTDGLSPGEVIPADGDITINENRETATVEVENTGDRAVQVGSHFHLFEVNRGLSFDRERAFGMHLGSRSSRRPSSERNCLSIPRALLAVV